MPASLRQFLQQRCVSYAEANNRSTATPEDRAKTADVSGRHCAKLILCAVDGDLIEAVLPASLAMNLNRLLALAGGREIRPATAEEVQLRSRDRDAETMAESESVHGQRVFVDVALVSATEIAIVLEGVADPACVGWGDFARTVRPIVGKFAEPPLLWARCRMSPSE
jgi:hypothetical protein